MLAFRLCLALAAALLCGPAAAQTPGTPADAAPDVPAGATADECTYDLCALRIEPALFGPRIVAGADGVPVGRLSLFGGDLSAAVASNEVALEQARIYEDARLPSVLAAVGASLLLSVSSASEVGGDASVRTGALVGAVALSVVGIRLGLRSQRAASRAVWEYNRDLPR